MSTWLRFWVHRFQTPYFFDQGKKNFVSFKIIGKPRLVFGGINESFVHATSTEEFLMGRNMNDHEMFLEAMTILATELVPTDEPVLTSAIYRKQLALGLFYKVHIFNINNKLLFISL